MATRSERLAAGAREDLDIAKAQRRSAAKAYASGQANKSDYDAAVAEIDRRIARLEAAIAGYETPKAAKTQGRYRLTLDDSPIGCESTYDRACAVAREASRAGLRAQVSLNDRTGRVLAAYKEGREVFYTATPGGREF